MIESTFHVQDPALAENRYKLHQMLCDGKVHETDDSRVLFTLVQSQKHGHMLKTLTRSVPKVPHGMSLISSVPQTLLEAPGSVAFIVTAAFRARVAMKSADGSIYFRDANLGETEATQRFQSLMDKAGIKDMTCMVAQEPRITLPSKGVKRSFLPHTFAVQGYASDVEAFNHLLTRGIGRGRAFGLGMIVLLAH